MGSGKKRNRWEIIQDVLKVMLDEKKANKTRIMQRACLDWRIFQKYFDFLLEEGFIARCSVEVGKYELADKGRNLLERLKDVDNMLSKKEDLKILILVALFLTYYLQIQ
jgi:predicted transcriptional regulator